MTRYPNDMVTQVLVLEDHLKDFHGTLGELVGCLRAAAPEARGDQVSHAERPKGRDLGAAARSSYPPPVPDVVHWLGDAK